MGAVLEGDLFLSREAAQAMDQRTPSPPIPVLTRRKKEVLLLIADGHTNMEIAEKLIISSTTVDTHRKNLLIKFQGKNTASLVRMASESGVI